MRKVRRIRRQGQDVELIAEQLAAVPASAAAIDSKVELIQALIPLGLLHVQESLQQEVERLAGPRYAREGGNPGVVRYGTQPGSIYLADQKLGIEVPRVRNLHRNREVPLRTYQQLQHPRAADQGVVQRILTGLTCREYERCAEAAREGGRARLPLPDDGRPARPGSALRIAAALGRSYRLVCAGTHRPFAERDDGEIGKVNPLLLGAPTETPTETPTPTAPPTATFIDTSTATSTPMATSTGTITPTATPTPLCVATPRVSCRPAEKSSFLLKRGTDSGRDDLTWKWTNGNATTQAEFGDPTTTADYALCIYGGAASSLVGEAIIPASASKWRSAGNGYSYRDPTGTAGGVTSVTLRGSAVNKSKALAKGKGAGLPNLSLPVTAPLTVQLVNGSNGLCWGSSYSAAQILKDAAGQLKAKAP